MSYLSSSIEIASPVREFDDAMLNRLLTAEVGGGKSEKWLAFVDENTELDSFEEISAAVIKHETENLSELSAPLPMLTAGPWRSLGGCLDYTRWADRDRFRELDKILSAAPSFRTVAA
jgi:hypothetical protein